MKQEEKQAEVECVCDEASGDACCKFVIGCSLSNIQPKRLLELLHKELPMFLACTAMVVPSRRGPPGVTFPD
jgi:hypothetical protein